jgi:hypothetical protein
LVLNDPQAKTVEVVGINAKDDVFSIGLES